MQAVASAGRTRDRGAPRDPITVVSGLPRSGTSLMMQILDGAGIPLLHDGRRPPDPSNPRGYFELEAVKGTRRDAGWVDRAPGHAVKVIHALLADLPRDRAYRVVWMDRPLSQVVASQNAMLARLGRDPDDLPLDVLERAFRAQTARACALLERERCFAWTRVSYPDLVHAPRGTLTGLCGFLDLDAPLETLAARVDPDLHRSR